MATPSGAAPATAIYAGIALTTMAVLVAQVALTRLFSYTIWYHFAYVTLGTALLGYGAAGALAAVRPRASAAALSAYASLAGLSVPLVLAAVAFIPFRPFALVEEPASQLLPFVAMVTAIGIPFVLAGLAVANAISSWSERVGRVYLVDLAGAGIGCALVSPLIWGLSTPGALAAAGGLLGLGGIAFAREGAPSVTRRAVAAFAATALLGVGAVATIDYRPSPEKLLNGLFTKGGSITFSRWTPIYRTDVFEFTDEAASRKVGHADWGASPRWKPAARPRAHFIAHDGDACALIYEHDGTAAADAVAKDIFDHHIVAAPYVLGPRPRTLVIGVGGGADILNAVVHGATSVLGIELDPETVALVGDRHARWAGGLYQRPGVDVRPGEGRSVLRREPGPFDLIQLTGVDTLAALSTGAYVLSESYLYTVEALADMRAKLAPGGVVSYVIADVDEDIGVPRHTLRLLSLGIAALERDGVANPASHLALLASTEGIPQVAFLLTRDPIGSEELARLERFARDMRFEVWAIPGRTAGRPGGAERLHSRLARADGAERGRILAELPLDVSATRDDHPFFFHFYRWRDLWTRRHEIDTGHNLATGQILLLAMLAQSLLFGALLILLPLLLLARRGLAVPSGPRFAIYFGAIGLGFILVEISLVQRLVLFLGYPTYALTVALSAILVAAGIGSGLEERVEAWLGSRRRLAAALLGCLGLLTAGSATVWPSLLGRLLAAPFPVRVLVAVVALAPLGITLGMFFPLGIRTVRALGGGPFVPWAWGINGVASVVGTVLAVIVSMAVGFQDVALIALGCYAVAVASLPAGAGSR